jgi:glycosyltransferase involved in cell wall biosynthesis
LGAITPDKGLNILLDAVKNSKEHLNIKIGGIPKNKSLFFKYISKQIGLMSSSPSITINLLGEIIDTKAFFNSIDILVVPSHREAFGLVAIEALAHGVPVICSNLGGTREVIENEVNGLYFESGNADSLCEILKRIVVDKGLLEKLTQNSIGSVDKWSIENTAKSFIHLNAVK